MGLREELRRCTGVNLKDRRQKQASFSIGPDFLAQGEPVNWGRQCMPLGRCSRGQMKCERENVSENPQIARFFSAQVKLLHSFITVTKTSLQIDH